MTRFGIILLFAAALAAPASAQVQASRNMELLSHRDDYPVLSNGRGYSSCWSYVHSDGREFAVLGHYSGTAIYEVTDPVHPVLVAFITGPPSIWRNMKSYRDWIYIVTEGTGAGEGVQIVRMTDPDHPVLAATYSGSFTHAHTVAVDTARALMVCNGTRDDAQNQVGMVILSLADPEAPFELVTWPGPFLGGVDSLYVHDSVIQGDRLFASCVYAGIVHVLDIADPSHPVELSQWSYPGGFSHNAWPDDSGQWLYVTDEVRGEPLKVFDISNLAAPVLANEVTSNPSAVIHNVYVHGDEAYLANYTEGTRVLDIADPAHPAEFAWADTWPGTSIGFNSVWNVCPYYPSGIVIASDRETGLYVFRPVRDYGIVRLEVSLAPAAGPAPAGGGAAPEIQALVPAIPAASVGGVEAQVETEGDSLVVPADGVVRFAPSPGLHSLRVHAFGWYDATADVNVTAGSSQTVSLTLIAKPTAQISGTVRNAATLAPLDDAEVSLEEAPIHVHTDAAGGFDLGAVPQDPYTLEVHRPGYVPIVTPFTAGATADLDLKLEPAPGWDPLETDTGWIFSAPGDNAVTGIWTRVDPLGTGGVYGGTTLPAVELAAVSATAEGPRRGAGIAPEHEGGGPYHTQVQPEDDRTPGAGTMCFVTGQGTSRMDVWEQDVSGGITTLTSPPLDVSAMSDPVIGYWRWFYRDGDDNDWLAVLLSGDDGATWTPVDTTRGLHNDWEERAIRVADHVAPGPAVRVRFIAADRGAGSVVEAGVDDLTLYEAPDAVLGAPGPARAERFELSAPRPNPARGAVTLSATLPAPGRLRVDVLDVAGRRLRTLHDGAAAAGTLVLRWDGRTDSGAEVSPGLYMMSVRLGGRTVVRRVAHVR